jgi:hypothetical protein
MYFIAYKQKNPIKIVLIVCRVGISKDKSNSNAALELGALQTVFCAKRVKAWFVKKKKKHSSLKV